MGSLFQGSFSKRSSSSMREGEGISSRGESWISSGRGISSGEMGVFRISEVGRVFWRGSSGGSGRGGASGGKVVGAVGEWR
jgi:hypothetical protein